MTAGTFGNRVVGATIVVLVSNKRWLGQLPFVPTGMGSYSYTLQTY